MDRTQQLFRPHKPFVFPCGSTYVGSTSQSHQISQAPIWVPHSNDQARVESAVPPVQPLIATVPYTAGGTAALAQPPPHFQTPVSVSCSWYQPPLMSAAPEVSVALPTAPYAVDAAASPTQQPLPQAMIPAPYSCYQTASTPLVQPIQPFSAEASYAVGTSVVFTQRPFLSQAPFPVLHPYYRVGVTPAVPPHLTVASFTSDPRVGRPKPPPPQAPVAISYSYYQGEVGPSVSPASANATFTSVAPVGTTELPPPPQVVAMGLFLVIASVVSLGE